MFLFAADNKRHTKNTHTHNQMMMHHLLGIRFDSMQSFVSPQSVWCNCLFVELSITITAATAAVYIAIAATSDVTFTKPTSNAQYSL